jgi:uncharacterized protein (DUF2252 family)
VVKRMRWISASLMISILAIASFWLLPVSGGERPHAAASAARAGGDPGYSAPTADGHTLDVLLHNYAPYCTPGDDLAFPMKVWALSENKFLFWRGSRDLYFAWCAQHARDWFDDKAAYVVNHGDLHLNNIGTYVKRGDLGATSFGPVDFDETARLPFQIELLQGLIMLRLTARENNIDLGGRREDLARAMFESYRSAVASDKTTVELVSEEKQMGKFIEQVQKHSYDRTLEKFTDGKGHFVPHVRTKHWQQDAPKEILRPAKDRADDMARGLAQAIANSPAAKAAFRYSDVETIRNSIKDVVLRTRLESVGSQGLKKYLVLLDKPLKGIDMDVVMYLKQEIPAAAERAGAIPMDPRSPGQRCSEDMNVLTNPTAYLNSWCDISTPGGKESYWVTFKEPWSEEIEPQTLRNYSKLQEAAEVWGAVAGTMHRIQGKAQQQAILERLVKPKLFDDLRHLSNLYTVELDRQYDDFMRDPRARAEAAKAKEQLDAAKVDVQASLR